MSETPPHSSDDAIEGRRPLRKNPFFWAALAGALLIPAIRPLTRRVPPPPPVSRSVAPFEASDQRGRPAGSAALRDQVYLVTFLDSGAGAEARQEIAALVKLQRRCARQGVRLWLLTFGRDPGRDTPDAVRGAIERAGGDLSLRSGDCGDSRTGCGSWIVAAAPPAVARGFLEGVGPRPRTTPAGAPLDPLPPEAQAVLVDGDGGARGAYATDDDGLDEVFHRAQHVMSLRRSWR